MPPMQQPQRPRWHGPQRRIGLTGGIASGKSSVGRLLAARGVPVLDADQYARDALAPGSLATQAVLEGERVRAASSRRGAEPEAAELDRAALGRIVFADGAERRWLEQLVHPLVRARFEDELARLAGAPAVVLVVPLLFEAGLEGLCSEVWLVDCEAEQQLKRLMQRDGLSEAAAAARIQAQWPLERKRPLADQLIDNRTDPSQLPARLGRLLKESAQDG